MRETAEVPGSSRVRRTAALLTAAVVSLVLLESAPAPFVWILALWAAVLGWIARARRRAKPDERPLWFALVPIAVLFALAEAAVAVLVPRGDGTRLEIGPWSTEHPTLGYALRPDTQASARKYFGSTLLYEVTYTIGPDGLRVRPEGLGVDDRPAVVFFGASGTFGEGVEDDETMPWATELALGGRYRCYNFAAPGYGPHHMLAFLQEGAVRERIDVAPRFVVCSVRPSHGMRCAGKAAWDPRGPRYVLDERGGVRREGQFEAVATPGSFLRERALRSGVVRWVVRPTPFTEDDYPLLAAIVDQARRTVEERGRGELHVLAWDFGRLGEAMADALEGRGLRVHRVSALVPDYRERKDAYTIPHDGHPRPGLHARIARYVASEIVAPASGGEAEPTGPVR